MGNTVYDNFYLSNEVEDQYNSHLDLQQFVTVDNSLVGTAGMKRVINKYSATNGTQKLTQGNGNTKSIEVSYDDNDYTILLAQNRFEYFDEEAMKDPMLVPVGMRHMGTDLFNTVNADIYAEFLKATLTVTGTAWDFGIFADAVAKMNVENLEGTNSFCFVSNADMAGIRKALKDDLKYVEAFSRSGYVGTVAGVNLYIKKDATPGTAVVATRDAVTLFNKRGVEIEQPPRDSGDANIRKNTIFARKYYLPALTDERYAVKVTIGAAG